MFFRESRFMVSYLSRYETPTTNTSLPEAIYVANHGDAAHPADPYGTQPGGAADHPFCDRRWAGTRRKALSGPVGASPAGPGTGFRDFESGQPLLVRMDRGARGLR